MPSHELNRRLPDDNFVEEFEAAKLHDFNVILFDYDTFVCDNKLILFENKVIGSGVMVYRGYMLSDEQYSLLYETLQPKYKLINSPKEYNTTHYFPEVYDYIKNHTAKSVWFIDITLGNISNALNQLSTKLVFMKDYVKSAKGNVDFALLENKDPKDWFDIIKSFIEYRGKLFNKGIVLKEYVDFKKYNYKTNEWRCVFLNRKLVFFSQNSNLENVSLPNVEWVSIIASYIPSNFFTIDIAELEDGTFSIIETGDGQVSGPTPNQNMLEYYNNIKNVLTT